MRKNNKNTSNKTMYKMQSKKPKEIQFAMTCALCRRDDDMCFCDILL